MKYLSITLIVLATMGLPTVIFLYAPSNWLVKLLFSAGVLVVGVIGMMVISSMAEKEEDNDRVL